ncbi:unnamed protein product [Moneuplotes crassus]|uniref:Uncharacterized protein n=2 Tax=Euplotes crassus TaxID=5936 RepID=A0AAD1Y2E6_EUPCR|nr:unnamed protein product [Moneuplotes crassus]
MQALVSPKKPILFLNVLICKIDLYADITSKDIGSTRTSIDSQNDPNSRNTSPSGWNQEVMNLFSQNSALLPSDITVPEMPQIYKRSHQNDEKIRNKEREMLMKQLEKFDENVKHAILLSKDKELKSDFYRKLEILADRIHIYRNIFYTRKPVFDQTMKAEDNVKLKRGSKSPSKRVRFRNSNSKKLPVIGHRTSHSDLTFLDSSKKRSMNNKYKHLLQDGFDKMMKEVIKEEGILSEKGRQSVRRMYKTSSFEENLNLLSKVEDQRKKFPEIIPPFKLQREDESLPNLACFNTLTHRGAKVKKFSPKKKGNRAFKLRKAVSIRNLQELEQSKLSSNRNCNDIIQEIREPPKKFNRARIDTLAQPRISQDPSHRASQSAFEPGDYDLRKSRLLALKNSKSLKKLKYKAEFLSAIKDLTTDVSESPDKKQTIGFSPSLSLKKSMIIYQSATLEDENVKQKKKKKFQIPQKHKIIQAIESKKKMKDVE